MNQRPSHAVPSLEETLLTLDHLLGKMRQAMQQQEQAMQFQLGRLEAAVALSAPTHTDGDAQEALRTEELNFCIRECSEWLRNHQHAADQHLQAINILTERVMRLAGGESARSSLIG